MRTTLDLPDDLFRKAKIRAAEKSLPLKEVMAQLIEVGLKYSEKEFSTQRRISLPLIACGKPGELAITEDLIAATETNLDLDRHEASL